MSAPAPTPTEPARQVLPTHEALTLTKSQPRMPQKLRRLPLTKGAPRKLPPLPRLTTDTSQADYESGDDRQWQRQQLSPPPPPPPQQQYDDLEGMDGADMEMMQEPDLLGGCGLPDDDFDDDDAD